MGYDRSPFRYARVCACGDHGFVGLTRGHVALLDASDVSKVADKIWSLTSHAGRAKYAARHDDGVYVYMHRLIMPGVHVDHASGDGLDNRRENLRGCSPAENLKNRRAKATKPIPFKGVYAARSGAYYARIMKDGRSVYLGNFPTITDAARAYDAAAINLHGAFAATNVMLGLLPAEAAR